MDLSDADLALASIERDVAHAQARATLAARVQDDVAALRGTGRSPAGDVVVVTDVAGRLHDVRLTASALQTGPASLSRALVSAARAAEAHAARQTLTVVGEAFGADSATLARLQAELAGRPR